MGADESKPSRKRNTRDLTANDISLLLQSQKEEYERKCREYQQSHITSNQPLSGTSNQSYAVPSVQGNTMTATAHTTAGLISTNNLERQRTPYSYTQNDLKSEPHSSNNLYPRVDDFVVVNKGDVNRTQPSAPARERSVSRSRPQKAGKAAQRIHACPTCKMTYGIIIFNCPSGHGSCEECKLKRKHCGVCGLHITEMRNRALEDYMAETKSPCPNEKEGCYLHFKLADIEFHLKECPFNEMRCPLAPIHKACTWRGMISQVSEHISLAHPENCHINIDTEANLPNIYFDETVMHFVTLGPFKFVFTLKVSSADRMIYVLAQMLGTRISATKWNYEIHIYNKREPRRKYQYIDICQAASLPIDTIIKDFNCCAIPLQHGLTYINEGALTYKFYIRKDCADQRELRNKNYRGRGGARRKN